MQQGREDFLAILRRAGLLGLGERAEIYPLAGGVSSDIWRVDIDGRLLCLKRALGKLKVDADWRVTTQRSFFEAGWMQVVDVVRPGATPKILHLDASSTSIVMEYLEPNQHALWKDELLAGTLDKEFATKVGSELASIHAATAGLEPVRNFFTTDRIFREIRIEPYLIATSEQYPTLASKMRRVAVETMSNKHALVHGDISPKNILVGPNGPIFLDAECAWYGDPAFDLAFCLNHLLLKCAHRRDITTDYLDCFRALQQSYFSGVDWEPLEDIESRTAALLPCLFLARVDGKSPVEYLRDDAGKNKVRAVAQRYIQNPATRLENIVESWSEEITSD